jgi:hypothetical protein
MRAQGAVQGLDSSFQNLLERKERTGVDDRAKSMSVSPNAPAEIDIESNTSGGRYCLVQNKTFVDANVTRQGCFEVNTNHYCEFLSLKFKCKADAIKHIHPQVV